MRSSVFFVVLFFTTLARAADAGIEVGGHAKLRVVGQNYPGDSLFREAVGSRSLDATGILRLNVGGKKGRWRFDSAYQLLGLRADALPFTAPPNDDGRAFNLTDVLTKSGEKSLLHRLDRLWVGYTSEKTVVRLGRQALSWGNGLLYAPMDLVNPFDPTAIDTEYKAGDDMLYLQYLQDNGNDVQAAYVVRRNPVTGDIDVGEATTAVKYHGFAGAAEYDVLVAEHYGDPVIGVGGGHGIGGAMWSADLVVTDTDADTYVQVVTNLAYSWHWAGKNMSGAIEYFYNGFGQRGGRYDPASLAANPDLLVRLQRGELFTVGRHYLAGSIMIEMSPLWTLTPTILTNVADPSAFFQLVTNYSLAENMTLLASISVPLGSNGSEFGGIASGLPDRYLSSGVGVFAQFAWYF